MLCFASALAALVLASRLQLWELFFIEFLFGAADGLFLPAVSAAVPDTVPDADLVAANGLMGASEQATMIAGPAAGGVVVATLGTWGAFAFNGATFVAAAVGAIPVPSRQRATGQSLVSSIAEGIALIRSDRELRAVFALSCAEAATGGAVFVVGLPTLARTRLGLGAFGLGLILTAWGVGQLVGALSASRTGLPSRWGRLLIATTVVDACVFLAFSATSSVWLVVAILIPFGILVAYSSDVARPVWIQRHSRRDMMGRAFSLLELPYYSVAPAGMLVFGAIAARSLSAAFVAAAASSLAVAVLALSSATVRRLSM